MKMNLNNRINSKIIHNKLVTLKSLCFEVTESCNLKCKYCCYGDIYEETQTKTKQDLNIKLAIRLIDYVMRFRKKAIKTNESGKLQIAFYGGEPLMRIDFIKDVINYCKMNYADFNFIFTMTTNGVLLNKYFDFIVENNIHPLISLDGNEIANAYRVFENGKESFSLVFNNILQFKQKHPDFFEKYVSISTVLHNQNTQKETDAFFQEHFNKNALIGELNSKGVKKEKKEEFYNMFRNFHEIVANPEEYSEIVKQMKINTTNIGEAKKYLRKHTENFYSDIDDLIDCESKHYLPTGTCLPFSLKIFLTADGKILPCEQIRRDAILGFVTEEKVEIDFQEVADFYNTMYEKVTNSLCNNCYYSEICGQCAFFIFDKEDSKLECKGFMNKEEFQKYKETQIQFLENNPEFYTEILSE